MPSTQTAEQPARTPALTNPSQLKRWLADSGRRWVIMDAVQLVDALSWPDDVQLLQEIIMAYRTHRAGVLPAETGADGSKTTASDQLTVAELKDLRDWVDTQLVTLDADR